MKFHFNSRPAQRLLGILVLSWCVSLIGCLQPQNEDTYPMRSSLQPTIGATPGGESVPQCGPLTFRPGSKYTEHFLKWTPDGTGLILNDIDAIKIINAQGSRLQTIVGVSVPSWSPFDFYADISPDGSEIVYSRCEYHPDLDRYNYGISVVSLNDSSTRRLTRGVRFEHFPVWSPNGTHIAFVADLADEHWMSKTQLFTLGADGAGLQPLTPSMDGIAYHPPVWSPDAQIIAFTAEEGDSYPGQSILYTVHADGSHLTGVAETLSQPAWSPDGQWLAFVTEDVHGEAVYIAHHDGTEVQQVASGFGGSVSWNADGSRILIANGTHSVRQAGIDIRRELPYLISPINAWSPDGTEIAFYAVDRGLVIVTSINGTNLRVLARRNAHGYLVAWTPPGSDKPATHSGCSAGTIVPNPKANPDLVKDCHTLFDIQTTLSYTATHGWNEDHPIMDWDGITVGGNPPRVHKLELRGAGLTGTIPQMINNLTSLKELNLGESPSQIEGLTGLIPPALADLKELEVLDLCNNYLSGNIPEELGNLPNLRRLNLGSNYLTGDIPPNIARLSTLDTLNLNGNALTGTIPSALGNLRNLWQLDLSGNLLDGTIPPELGNLPELNHLSLANNRLSGHIPVELGTLSTLSRLSLENNQLNGNIPQEMRGLINLTGVFIHGNRLGGCIPVDLAEIWVQQSGLDRC